MGDYWRTSGRSRLKVRARNGMGARAERRAAVARADFLYEAPPAGGTTKNHPKRPRRASEGEFIHSIMSHCGTRVDALHLLTLLFASFQCPYLPSIFNRLC